MKKNAVLIAGIMLVSGCAMHEGGYSAYNSGAASARLNARGNTIQNTESIDRTPEGAPTSPLAATASQYDPASFGNMQPSSTSGLSANAGNRDWRMDAEPSQQASQFSQYNQNEHGDLTDYGAQYKGQWGQQSSGLGQPNTGIASNGSMEQSPSRVAPLDDMTVPAASGSAAAYESNQGSSQSLPRDLNSSQQLQKDMTGQYNIANQSSQSLNAKGDLQTGSLNQNNGMLQGSAEGIGAPASGQTGYDTSLQYQAQPGEIGTSSEESHSLFQHNRAQGIGSAASGDLGVATSKDANLSGMNDDQLAEKVKSTLVNESTGVFTVTKGEARDLKVTAHNGTVTLRGAVPTERDKKTVEIRALQVNGVTRVDNQLTVSPEAKPASNDLGQGRNLEDTTDQLKDQGLQRQ